ncbi:MAG TPA: hypothetical protein VHE81_17610 [Lacipirellulaceae bacterium]|nr:hypothetical protein [Lacipirellulaceae bacterium]
MIMVLVGAGMLGACQFTDSSITPRIATLDKAYDNADNNEILTNIIRASRLQPLRFYQHNKIAPSQTSDVKFGLPNITFGPAKSAAAKDYVFTTATDNSASVSLELDPIETHDFHNSLLTPIQVGLIGLLLQNFPKEMVFLALLDSIRFQEANGTVLEYKNDPEQDSSSCPAYDYAAYDPGYTGPDLAAVSPYHPPGEGGYATLANCRYQRFLYWVEAGIAYGLTVDFSTVPNPKYDPNSKTQTQPKTILTGVFCLDPAQARPDLVRQLQGLPTALCEHAAGQKQAAPTTPHRKSKPTSANTKPETPSTSSADNRESTLTFPFTRGSQVVRATLGLRTRSLMATFLYLGKLLRHPDAVKYYTLAARSAGDNRMLTVQPAKVFDDCFAVAESKDACVPRENADNTKRLFSMLSELIQLNSTVSDTPASLTVRLTP